MSKTCLLGDAGFGYETCCPGESPRECQFNMRYGEIGLRECETCWLGEIGPRECETCWLGEIGPWECETCCLGEIGPLECEIMVLGSVKLAAG